MVVANGNFESWPRGTRFSMYNQYLETARDWMIKTMDGPLNAVVSKHSDGMMVKAYFPQRSYLYIRQLIPDVMRFEGKKGKYDYDWLVVTGSNVAKFKGIGTINGEGEFKFQIWAGDDDPDTFRIKIWEEDDLEVENVVYDNGFEGSGYENGQPIGGGSIVVHTKK